MTLDYNKRKRMNAIAMAIDAQATLKTAREMARSDDRSIYVGGFKDGERYRKECCAM